MFLSNLLHITLTPVLIMLHETVNIFCFGFLSFAKIDILCMILFESAVNKAYCYTSPYVKSHLIIHAISKKEGNNSTSR